VEEGPEPLPAVPEGQILSLSHYQVDDYLTCPLKYKYIHVLRVPIREHHSVVYGKALHEAISFYLRRVTAGQPPPLEEVLDVFGRTWEPVGFLSREHEELRLAEGKAVLARFVEAEGRRAVVPEAVERPFAFFLESTKVVGRWDRLDRRASGMVIVDYKSSAVQDQKEADRRARESLQLDIYALAHRQMHDALPAAVELYFLESGLVGAARKTEADLEATRERIAAVAKGIRVRDFRATPRFLSCSYCAFREICPSTGYKDTDQ
jgi:DNA helicase-2/ATP-dependent DNA helicase PcrA